MAPKPDDTTDWISDIALGVLCLGVLGLLIYVAIKMFEKKDDKTSDAESEGKRTQEANTETETQTNTNETKTETQTNTNESQSASNQSNPTTTMANDTVHVALSTPVDISKAVGTYATRDNITIDGVRAFIGMRVLLMGQSDAKQNGVWEIRELFQIWLIPNTSWDP